MELQRHLRLFDILFRDTRAKQHSLRPNFEACLLADRLTFCSQESSLRLYNLEMFGRVAGFGNAANNQAVAMEVSVVTVLI